MNCMHQSRGMMCLLQRLLIAASILESFVAATVAAAAENVGEITAAALIRVPEAHALAKSGKKTTANPTKNVCLKKEDKYRTCFTRAADPNNVLEEDTILRDEYNIAAAPSPKSGKRARRLAKASKSKGGKTSKSSVQPYSPPYIMDDEKLTEGTIYLSMVKEKAVKKMSCDDKIELEEATIEWLYDNLGNKRTFTPLCAFSDGYEFHEETIINANGDEETIAAAAFKMDLIFATKKDFDPDPSSRLLFDHRRLQCSQKQLQECCSVDSINDSMTEDQVQEFKQYCKKIGCKKNKCPWKKKKNSLRLLRTETGRFLIEGDLLGTNFNDVLGEYTDLAPVETGAVLDATSLEDLAVCRANNYNIVENDEPLLTCEEYEEAGCETNDYLIIEANETETFSPTYFPSSAPFIGDGLEGSSSTSSTSSPTYYPSYMPTTGGSSKQPSVCIEYNSTDELV